MRAQFNTVINLLNGYVVEGGNDQNGPIKDAIEALYMKTANFIDVLENIVPGALQPNPKTNFVLPRSLRKELVMPANKLKHEANEITLCGARWWAVKVQAFMILHMRERSKLANPDFHQHRDAFSFNVELKRLLVKIYKFASFVGKQIALLGFGIGATTETSDENGTLLGRLATLPQHCWWDEGNLMPRFEFDGETLQVDEKGGRASPINRYEARFTTLTTFDSYSRTYGFVGRRI